MTATVVSLISRLFWRSEQPILSEIGRFEDKKFFCSRVPIFNINTIMMGHGAIYIPCKQACQRLF
jgi:hypothetical protein